MNNRDKILDTALRLFNEHGTKAISTNHIAEAAKVSPGNLYYHFNDKESIIREIHVGMVRDWDAIWQNRAPQYTLEDLADVIRHNFILEWRYRFFYRELRAILQRDEKLTKSYQAHVKTRLTEQQIFLRGYSQHGVLQELDTDTLEDLLTTCWVLANHWIAHLEECGEPVDPAQLLRGEKLVLNVLVPYLTERAKAHLPTARQEQEKSRETYRTLLSQ